MTADDRRGGIVNVFISKDYSALRNPFPPPSYRGIAEGFCFSASAAASWNRNCVSPFIPSRRQSHYVAQVGGQKLTVVTVGPNSSWFSQVGPERSRPLRNAVLNLKFQ
jgi:hypothetical protein